MQSKEEDRYRVLFDMGNDARFVHPVTPDGPGIFTEVNETACKRLEYSREELLTLTPKDINDPNPQFSMKETMLKLKEKGSVVFETVHVTKTGRKIPVEISSQLFKLDGKPMVMSIARDITERKEAFRKMRALKEEAESATRLKSQFLANMSHDIRTPLNAVLGFTDLMLKEEKNEKSRYYLEKIRYSGEGLLTLLNDILDFSKIEAGQLDIYPQTFLLDELIDNVASIFELQAGEKNIRFEVYKAKDLPEKAYNDKWRLQQTLSNLLSNAFKFTKEGSVTLHAAFDKQTDMLQFSISDTGIGISEEQLVEIFYPFIQLYERGSPIKTGTGLGLAICKNLVDLMGGEIDVGSSKKKGTDFNCHIPANSDKVEEKVGPPETAAGPGLDIANKENTILIADDNQLNREVIVEQLKSEGYHSLLIAVDGEDAYRIVSSHQPDLVLMDILMPEMDGNEVIARLRREGYNKPIIALSAFAMRGEIENTLSRGATTYITKPIDFDVFFQLLNKYLPSSTPLTRSHKIKSTVSKRVREVFLQDAREKTKQLEEISRAGDMETKLHEIEPIAHNYKGNAAYLGLTELEAAASRLHQGIKSNESLEKVKDNTEHLIHLLKKILEENK